MFTITYFSVEIIMAKNTFKVSVSTISGGSVFNILKIFKDNKIEANYVPRALSSLAFSLMAEPFRLVEHFKFDSAINNLKIENPPIFILGHWRSGTTYLHYLLSQDPNMGTLSTFQAIAPGLCLVGDKTIKPLFNRFVQATRAIDNVAMTMDSPSEDDFAIANMSPHSFYHQWSFPRRSRSLFERYVLFHDLPDQALKEWQATYRAVLQMAALLAPGKRLVLKNL